MVEVIYKTSHGAMYRDELEAYRNDLKYLQGRKDLLLETLVRMKRKTLPRFTKSYLVARAKARAMMEDVRKNDDPKKKWLVRQEYFEALAKKFEVLNDLQIEIRAYKTLRAEYKEVEANRKKTLESYKALEAKE